MIELRVKLDPRDKARADALLARLEAQASNLSGALKNVGEVLLREQNRRFQSQTAPDGAPWVKLGPLTIALRGASGPILRRSGALMRSGAWQASGMTLRVGVNTIYAAVHQFGATITPKNAKMLAIPIGGARIAKSHGALIHGPASDKHPKAVMMAKKVTIPARPMVGFGDKDETATRRTIEAWLKAE